MSMEKRGVNSEYDEGWRAFHSGLSASSCPHTDPAQKQNWKDGWYDAMEASEQETESPQS